VNETILLLYHRLRRDSDQVRLSFDRGAKSSTTPPLRVREQRIVQAGHVHAFDVVAYGDIQLLGNEVLARLGKVCGAVLQASVVDGLVEREPHVASCSLHQQRRQVRVPLPKGRGDVVAALVGHDLVRACVRKGQRRERGDHFAGMRHGFREDEDVVPGSQASSDLVVHLPRILLVHGNVSRVQHHLANDREARNVRAEDDIKSADN